MSDDNTREMKPEEKGAAKQDEIKDLTDDKVSEKDAGEVKGGSRILNFPFETGKPS